MTENEELNKWLADEYYQLLSFEQEKKMLEMVTENTNPLCVITISYNDTVEKKTWSVPQEIIDD